MPSANSPAPTRGAEPSVPASVAGALTPSIHRGPEQRREREHPADVQADDPRDGRITVAEVVQGGGRHSHHADHRDLSHGRGQDGGAERRHPQELPWRAGGGRGEVAVGRRRRQIARVRPNPKHESRRRQRPHRDDQPRKQVGGAGGRSDPLHERDEQGTADGADRATRQHDADRPSPSFRPVHVRDGCSREVDAGVPDAEGNDGRQQERERAPDHGGRAPHPAEHGHRQGEQDPGATPGAIHPSPDDGSGDGGEAEVDRPHQPARALPSRELRGRDRPRDEQHRERQLCEPLRGGQ